MVLAIRSGPVSSGVSTRSRMPRAVLWLRAKRGCRKWRSASVRSVPVTAGTTLAAARPGDPVPRDAGPGSRLSSSAAASSGSRSGFVEIRQSRTQPPPVVKADGGPGVADIKDEKHGRGMLRDRALPAPAARRGSRRVAVARQSPASALPIREWKRLDIALGTATNGLAKFCPASNHPQAGVLHADLDGDGSGGPLRSGPRSRVSAYPSRNPRRVEREHGRQQGLAGFEDRGAARTDDRSHDQGDQEDGRKRAVGEDRPG